MNFLPVFFSIICSTLLTASLQASERDISSKKDISTVIAVVGTIHRMHLAEPEYNLNYLKKTIEDFSPDLILVEIRPEPFKEGRYEDGPFEMTYIVQLAKSAGIRVQPIDWWTDKQIETQEVEVPKAYRKAYYEEMQKSDDILDSLTFKEVNSDSYSANRIKYQNLEARYNVQNSLSWLERQGWMNYLALQAIELNKSKRVLIFVGAEHRPEMHMFLQVQPQLSLISPMEILNEKTTANLPSTQAQPEVIALWEQGIKRMENAAREALNAKQTELSERLTTKIKYFRTAVKLKGKCCVDKQ